MRAAMSRLRLRPLLELLVIAGVLFISNRFTWLCVFEVHRPVYWCEYGSFADELVVYFVLVLIVAGLLARSHLARDWIAAWRRNVLVIAFVAWCCASALWSVSPVHTVYRSLLALCAAVVASYLGVRYGTTGWIVIMAWFAAVTTVLGFLLVWFHPQAAIMSTSSLVGAWRGAFAQRNLTAAIMSYGAAVLALAVILERRRWRSLLFGSLAAAAAVFVGFTGSATGMIILVCLLGLLVIALGWIRFRGRLQRGHYLAFGAVLVAAVWLVSTHTAELFQFLGKSASLTGRLPLWEFVISEAARRPWIGYGLWTAWRFGLFRNLAAREAGWPTPIGDSHNGYLDILLYLGIVGLTLFVAIAVQAGWRAVRSLKDTRSPGAIWAMLTVAYILVANLTISFILNRESFHWLLLVVATFALSQNPRVGDAAMSPQIRPATSPPAPTENMH